MTVDPTVQTSNLRIVLTASDKIVELAVDFTEAVFDVAAELDESTVDFGLGGHDQSFVVFGAASIAMNVPQNAYTATTPLKYQGASCAVDTSHTCHVPIAIPTRPNVM